MTKINWAYMGNSQESAKETSKPKEITIIIPTIFWGNRIVPRVSIEFSEPENKELVLINDALSALSDDYTVKLYILNTPHSGVKVYVHLYHRNNLLKTYDLYKTNYIHTKIVLEAIEYDDYLSEVHLYD